MDIFNKKKVKNLEWDLMATKARLESKESELNRVNNSILKMYDGIEEAFNNLYVGKYIKTETEVAEITKFSCQGGVPVIYGFLLDGTSVKINVSWEDVFTIKTVKKPKTKK